MSSVGSSMVIGGRAGVVNVGDRVADVDPFQPDDGADVAGADLVGLDPAEAVEDVELRHLVVDPAAVAACSRATRWPLRILPAMTWPMAMRPT